jgi:F-type H+-transporting ATPase subunit a
LVKQKKQLPLRPKLIQIQLTNHIIVYKTISQVKTNTILAAFMLLFISLFANSAYAGGPAKEGEDMKVTAVNATMHHIGDAHDFHIFGDVHLPLPCMAYSAEGFFFAMSSAFHHGQHAIDGYMMHHGTLYKIKNFGKTGTVDLTVRAPKIGGQSGDNHTTVDSNGVHNHHADANAHNHADVKEGKNPDGKKAFILSFDNNSYELEAASSIQGLSSWYDFSITKNVFSMFLAFLLMFFIFKRVATAYEVRHHQSPKGIQSLLEPVIVFLRDEVAKPGIGKSWERFFPFLLSLFFFILINNLIGLVPFFPGSSNVTGNLGTTIVLAFFTFLVVNFSGNKHYWQHIFWMPGVPAFVKVILTPIEVIGIFLKPITLFIRLFANITAGHIIILSLVSLIFIFNSTGQLGGGPGGIAIAVPFVFALNFMELLVAFLQAFIFTLLTALYIGSAVEEHHHEEHAHEEGAAHH